MLGSFHTCSSVVLVHSKKGLGDIISANGRTWGPVPVTDSRACSTLLAHEEITQPYVINNEEQVEPERKTGVLFYYYCVVATIQNHPK